MRVALVGSVVAVLALMVGVPAVAAHSRTATQNEPRVGSPAGVIYQIPLDSARRDAAPVLPVGSHGGPGGPGSPGGSASIHSENGFGSSSKVPGITAAALHIKTPSATSSSGASWPTYLLLAFLTAAAIAVGVFANGARRRRSGDAAGERPPDA